MAYPDVQLYVDVAPRLNPVKVAEPPKRSAGVTVSDAKTLVDKLRGEAKVIDSEERAMRTIKAPNKESVRKWLINRYLKRTPLSKPFEIRD